MAKLAQELVSSVREYYDWLGDRNAKPVRFVVNKYYDWNKMLLSRFTDSDGNKMSSLMEYQEWKDGHWDVTEVYVADREDEAELVRGFEESLDCV